MSEKKKIKTINLALQGGGSHGAYTWGVLDRFLEQDNLKITAICGTSAGAMNAAVLAYGLTAGDHKTAQKLLKEFWERIGKAAVFSPIRPTPLDKLLNPGNLDFNPAYIITRFLENVSSPYLNNPMNINPLKDILEDIIDFKVLKGCECIQLFSCATNVLTGKIKIFDLPEMSPDALCASVALPDLFQAVKINGNYYWDGGFMGNPPLFPLIENSDCPDLLIVQVNPVEIPNVPKSPGEIKDRVNTISFNSTLMRELRSVRFINRLVEKGIDDNGKLKYIYIHNIRTPDEMLELGVSSKMNADWNFLKYLHELGKKHADRWIENNYDHIGKKTTCPVQDIYL